MSRLTVIIVLCIVAVVCSLAVLVDVAEPENFLAGGVLALAVALILEATP